MSADCIEYMGKNIYRDGRRYLTCSESFKTLAAAKAWLRYTYLDGAQRRVEVAYEALCVAAKAFDFDAITQARLDMDHALNELDDTIELAGEE